ncbi:hypothetical protein RhiirB3_441728 [Rhizophagus irregularis]|nr:hypothetical protein RhiirB3_441728 [Rhizophagus irregularis]
MLKEQEKYKKRFKNSLKSNKNKWQVTNNGIGSKVLISKHKLKRRYDILKKQYISEKEMEFLVDQVTSEVGYKMLIDDIFINHSFNEEHFFELRKKKDASFERKDSKLAEQSSSAGQSATIDNIITDLQEMEISGQDNTSPVVLSNYLENCFRLFHHSVSNIKEEKQCGISGKDKKAKSHSNRTEVGVKNVGCKMLESNWNKWNDLAFHRGSHWANF